MKNAIIIDDQIICGNILFDMLQPYSEQLSVLEIFSSSKAALDYLMKHHIDVVFLDVEMPELNGFQLLEQLPKIDFDLIFVTAHEHYALKAIKFSVIDYLIKPISKNEFEAAINKYLKRVKSPIEYAIMLESVLKNVGFNHHKSQRLALPTTNGLELVDMKDIVRCEADRNYTKIFFANGNKILISKNLKEVEDMMDNELFFRVHQSHLININCIKKYIKGEGGQILLTDNTYVDVSRRKKENLLELLTHKI